MLRWEQTKIPLGPEKNCETGGGLLVTKGQYRELYFRNLDECWFEGTLIWWAWCLCASDPLPVASLKCFDAWLDEG
jgi:hypothetical protein